MPTQIAGPAPVSRAGFHTQGVATHNVQTELKSILKFDCCSRMFLASCHDTVLGDCGRSRESVSAEKQMLTRCTCAKKEDLESAYLCGKAIDHKGHLPRPKPRKRAQSETYRRSSERKQV